MPLAARRRGSGAGVDQVVDVATESVTIEATGPGEKLSALLGVLEPYGVRELVQSGIVAIGRGPRSITDRALRGA